MRPGIFNRAELRERLPVELPSELWSSICVLQTHAQRFEREKEIAEKNRCVEIKVLHGPKRNLSGQLGSLAQLHERVLLPQPLVMLVISSGLAHQPDRRGGFGAARPRPFKTLGVGLVFYPHLKHVPFSISPREGSGGMGV